VHAPKGILYDFADGWIPLVHQPRRRHVQLGEVVITEPLDGGEPGCVWHRLFLDGCVEAGSSIAVWSAASDDRSDLRSDPDWQLEPAPRPRAGGVELPYVEELAGYETHELLFQRARGRYLRLKLELRGDGRATPRLRALRASFPRFSYLEHYLPAVYREDPESASFLDRYLANIEGFFTNVEGAVAAVQVLFDPDAAPGEGLEWLASWFDAALDPAWDDATRRLYIRHATDLFRRRGTTRGIELALHLGLEGRLCESELLEAPPPGAHRPRVVEAYRSRQTPGVVWGDPTDLGGPRVRAGERWTPERGAVALDEAYHAYLRAARVTPAASERFTATRPSGSRGRLWERFALDTLGFVPQVPDPEGPLTRAWHGFLSRRYPNAGALNAAYGLVGDDAVESLQDVPLPDNRPADGAALTDWFQFFSVVVPMRGRAHRFTVLLPVPPGGNGPEADPAELRRRAERIVEIQKPAHTTFEVRFFWSAFRIGEARLGTDTLVDLGSRAPDLLSRLVLGSEHLGETYLAGPPASDRVRRPSVCAPTTAEEMQ
jgi:phage tail-like protein